MGLAVLADNAVYVVWLPILLGAKNLAPWFHRVVRVNPERIKMLEDTTFQREETQLKPSMRQILYLLFVGFAVTFAARQISGRLPQFPEDQPVLTTGHRHQLAAPRMEGIQQVFRPNQFPGIQVSEQSQRQ